MEQKNQDKTRKQKIDALLFGLEYAAMMTATDVRHMIRMVCKKAGVNYTTYWRWKKKDVMPDMRTYRKLMNAAHALQRQNPYLNGLKNDTGNPKG